MAMTKPKDVLADLIERLKQATGPDRELDVAIHAAIGRKFITAIDDDGAEYKALRHVPRYTESTDAAKTLGPRGRAIRTEYCPAGTLPFRVWIFKDQAMPLAENSGEPALGKTEPIALCIAALTAISKGAEHG
jgi:hypothetical protein